YNPFVVGDGRRNPAPKNYLNQRGTSQARHSTVGHRASTVLDTDSVEKKEFYFNDFIPPIDSGHRKLIRRNYKQITSALSDDKTNSSEPHHPPTAVICNEAAHASEVSSLLSWNMDGNASKKPVLSGTGSLNSSPEAFNAKFDRQTAHEATFMGAITEKAETTELAGQSEGEAVKPLQDSFTQHSSHVPVVDDDDEEEEVPPPFGKKNALLQTTEDFGNELKSNFSFPRILSEEDQTMEPGDNVEAQGPDDNGIKRSTDYWKDQFMTFFQPSDNKLAKKLFGTKMALNKERSRQRSQGKWIIHPCSNFR
ncbi:unnamed protein product, partial [Dibothriocephalus latus]